MKKILYIVDCTLNQCHSVRDILDNIVHQFDGQYYEQVIVNAYRTSRKHFVVENIKGFKTYYVTHDFNEIKSHNDLNVFQKFELYTDKTIRRIPRIRHIYKHWDTIQYFRKVFSLEKPDIVCFFYISPIKNFFKLCDQMSIPFVSILYDTFLDRPGITERDLMVEKEQIKHSVAYFVPNFFLNSYRNHYHFDNIYQYHLPLLISVKDVTNAYQNSKIIFDFSYFGQMQSFRNSERVKEIFSKLNFVLNIFSMENRESDDIFIFHSAVSQKDLYDTVASSRFLVAFDNGEPYSHYLPSKAYLYVSFTKPIIVFGNNHSSALMDFLDGYPYYYYYNIDNGSEEELLRFIERTSNNNFNENVYSKYIDYLPSKALRDIKTAITRTLCR